MNKKIVYFIDMVLVVGTLVAIIASFMYVRPTLTSPVNGFITQDPVLFSFEKGDAILLDDNLEFTSPQRFEVKDDVQISLEPGVYYWKVEGIVASEVRQLTITSLVDLRVRRAGEGYELVNNGNTRLNVSLYEKGVLTGTVILDKEESGSAAGDQFIGGQNE